MMPFFGHSPANTLFYLFLLFYYYLFFCRFPVVAAGELDGPVDSIEMDPRSLVGPAVGTWKASNTIPHSLLSLSDSLSPSTGQNEGCLSMQPWPPRCRSLAAGYQALTYYFVPLPFFPSRLTQPASYLLHALCNRAQSLHASHMLLERGRGDDAAARHKRNTDNIAQQVIIITVTIRGNHGGPW